MKQEPVSLAGVRLPIALLVLIPILSGFGRSADQPRLLDRVIPLPTALSDDFQFRKTKLYLLTESVPGQGKSGTDQAAQGTSKGGKLSSTAPSSKSTTVQDASIRFERQYRLFGAVTNLDQRERMGNYFDFFWKARRPADLTVRLEYRQEKMHSHVQAQEIFYSKASGSHKTEIKVVGDEYFYDGGGAGRRCLLIQKRRGGG